MASRKPAGVFSPSPSVDSLLLPALLSRLQLRSTVDLHSDLDDNDLAFSDDKKKHRRRLSREEARLEREIIRIVHSGNADKALKPNSGQSVAIGDDNICVAVHEEPGSGYRIWEWHGHIMFFDEENGYNAEYIYGSYFERLQEKNSGMKEAEEYMEEQEEEEEEEEVKVGGLRDLIGGSNGSLGNGGGRVLHRNSLNGGSAK